jgi:hypothetical protein
MPSHALTLATAVIWAGRRAYLAGSPLHFFNGLVHSLVSTLLAKQFCLAYARAARSTQVHAIFDAAGSRWLPRMS